MENNILDDFSKPKEKPTNFGAICLTMCIILLLGFAFFAYFVMYLMGTEDKPKPMIQQESTSQKK